MIPLMTGQSAAVDGTTPLIRAAAIKDPGLVVARKCAPASPTTVMGPLMWGPCPFSWGLVYSFSPGVSSESPSNALHLTQPKRHFPGSLAKLSMSSKLPKCMQAASHAIDI
uniref:Uncharacterized protein n=1 Tax=Timema genevievae TaxID=629358 RepID=A0A7R9PPI0_TIMGE|nr:unnamed protein product [Timema genevievae]